MDSALPRPMFCGAIIEEEEEEDDDDYVDEDVDDDYDDDTFLAEKLKQDVAALRQACQLSGLPNFPDPAKDFEDYCAGGGENGDGDDDDDDDKLLLSIQKRFGGAAPLPTLPSRSSIKDDPWIRLDEEDDDEILRLVEQRASAMFRLHRADEESSHLKTASERVKAMSNEANVVANVDTLGSDNSRALVSADFFNGTGTGISSDPVIGNEALGAELSLEFSNQAETRNDRDDGNPEEPVHTSREKVPPILPESLRLVFDALKKNRLFQRVLRSKLVQVEAKLEKNTKLTRRVKTINKYERICKQRYTAYFAHTMNASVEFISLPKKRKPNSSSKNPVRKDEGPPENEDVAKFRSLPKIFPLNFRFRRWTVKESNELGKGVKQQVQEHLINSVIEQFSNDNTGNLELFDEQVQAVAGKPLTAAEIHSSLPHVNWNEVARVYVINRSAVECQAQWLQHEDPSIHHGPWTKAEDKRLLSISQRLDLCNWDVIATELGTRRTAAQCLIRYQRSLNAGIMRGNWTNEEDMQLRAVVERCGANDWTAVAAYMEGRNGSQCFNRWYHMLHPWRKKSGKWSDEEDKRLRCAVSVHGPRKWKVIASYVVGRTEVQCRERWSNVLNPSLKFDMWTEEEDKKLEEAVAKYGLHHWSSVAKEIQPRTDNQCWRRWKLLHPEILCEFWKHVRIQKSALISNFVGRRKERPGLGPNDFTVREGDDSSRYCPDSMKKRKKAGGDAAKKNGNKIAGAARKKGGGCGIQAEQSNAIAEDGSVLVQRKAVGVRKKKKGTYGSGATQDDVATSPAGDIPVVATKWRKKLIAIRKKEMEESIIGVPMLQLNDVGVSIDNATSLVTKKRGKKSVVKGDKQMEDNIVGAPIELNNVAVSVDNNTSLVMKKKGRKPMVKGGKQIEGNIVDAPIEVNNVAVSIDNGTSLVSPIELNNVAVSIDTGTSFVAKKRGRKPMVKGDKQIEENIVDAPMELNNIATSTDNGTSLVAKKRGRKPKVKGDKQMEENIVGAPIELNNIAVSIDNDTSLVVKKRVRKPKVKGDKQMEDNIFGAPIEPNNIAVSIDNDTSLVVKKRVRKPKVKRDKLIEENAVDAPMELNNIAVSIDNDTSLAAKKRRKKLAVKGDKELEEGIVDALIGLNNVAVSIDNGTSLIANKRCRKSVVKGDKGREEDILGALIKLNNVAVSIDNDTYLALDKRRRKSTVKGGDSTEESIVGAPIELNNVAISINNGVNGEKQTEDSIVGAPIELKNVSVSTDDATPLVGNKRCGKLAVKGGKQTEKGIVSALIGLNNAAVSTDSCVKGDKQVEESIVGAPIKLNNVAVSIDNNTSLVANKRRRKSAVKGDKRKEESIVGAPIEPGNVTVSIDNGVNGDKQMEESIIGAPIELNDVAISIDNGVKGHKQVEESIVGAPLELNNVAVSIDNNTSLVANKRYRKSTVKGDKRKEESIVGVPIEPINVTISIDNGVSGGKQTEESIVDAPIELNDVAISIDNSVKGDKQVEESIVGALIKLNNAVSIDNNTSLVASKRCRKSAVKGDNQKVESIVGAPIEPINVTISIDKSVSGDKRTEESIVGAPIELNNVAISIDDGVKGDKQMEESIVSAPIKLNNVAVSIDNSTSLVVNKRCRKSAIKGDKRKEESIVDAPIESSNVTISIDNGVSGDKQTEESIVGAPIELNNVTNSIDNGVKGDRQMEESIIGAPTEIKNVAVSIDKATSLVANKRHRKSVVKRGKRMEENIVGELIKPNKFSVSVDNGVKGDKQMEESIAGAPIELSNAPVSIDKSTSLVMKNTGRKLEVKGDKQMEESIAGELIELNNVTISIDQSTSLAVKKRGRKPVIKGDKRMEESIVGVPIGLNNAAISIDESTSLAVKKRGKKLEVKGHKRTEESIVGLPIELNNVAVSIDESTSLAAKKRGRKPVLKVDKRTEENIVGVPIELNNVPVSIDKSTSLVPKKRGRNQVIKGDKQTEDSIVGVPIKLNNVVFSIDCGVKGDNRTEESIVGVPIKLSNVAVSIDNGMCLLVNKRGRKSTVKGNKRTEGIIVDAPIELNNVDVSIDNSVKGDKQMEESIVGALIELNNAAVSIDNSTSLVAKKRGRQSVFKGDNRTEDSIVGEPIELIHVGTAIENNGARVARTRRSSRCHLEEENDLDQMSLFDNGGSKKAKKDSLSQMLHNEEQTRISGCSANEIQKSPNDSIDICAEGKEMESVIANDEYGSHQPQSVRRKLSKKPVQRNSKVLHRNARVLRNGKVCKNGNKAEGVSREEPDKQVVNCAAEEVQKEAIVLETESRKVAIEKGSRKVTRNSHRKQLTKDNGVRDNSSTVLQNGLLCNSGTSIVKAEGVSREEPDKQVVNFAIEEVQKEAIVLETESSKVAIEKGSRKVTRNSYRKKLTKDNGMQDNSSTVLQNGLLCDSGTSIVKAEGVSQEGPDKQVVNCAVEEVQKEAIVLETESSQVAIEKGSRKVTRNSHRKQLTKDNGMQDNSSTVLQNGLVCDSGTTQKSDFFALQDGGVVGAKNYQEIEKENDNVSGSSALQEEAIAIANGDLIHAIAKTREEADGGGHSTVVIPHDTAVTKRRHSTPSQCNSGSGNADEKPIASSQRKLMDSHVCGNEVDAVSPPLIRRSNRSRAQSEKAVTGWHLK